MRAGLWATIGWRTRNPQEYPMTPDEMETWQRLRVACLEILHGARSLRTVMPQHRIIERMDTAGVLQDVEQFMTECQERLAAARPASLREFPDASDHGRD